MRAITAIRWRLTAVVVSALAAASIIGVPLPTTTEVLSRPVARVHADSHDRLDITSTRYTYTIDLDAEAVVTRAELSLTNNTASRRDGDRIIRTYFDGITLPVPSDAENVGVSASAGSPRIVSDSVRDGNEYWRDVGIQFGTSLFGGQSLDVTVTYELTGLEPRSDEPRRANAAYVSFFATTLTDTSNTSVHVVAPRDLDVRNEAEPLADHPGVMVTDEGDVVRYVFDAIDDPAEFSVFVWAADDRQLTTSSVTAASFDVDIHAWPGDDEWERIVTHYVEAGLPVLTELIGFDADHEHLTIRQSQEQIFSGYEGVFYHGPGDIQLTEDAAGPITLHELSHNWFGPRLSDERWILEGLATAYANLALGELGEETAVPSPPRGGAPDGMTLHEWQPMGIHDDQVEDWGYDTSWYVVETIVDEIGPDRMRRVLIAAADDAAAYAGRDGPDDRPMLGRVNDWRRFLDLLEEVGGSEHADALFRDHVVDESRSALMDERAETREAYAELAEVSGEWAMPASIRHAMERWRFDTATRLVDEAHEVVELRDELDAASRAAGVRTDTGFEHEVAEAFESTVVGFDDAAELLTRRLDATATVIEAVDAEQAARGWWTRIGLIGKDPDNGLDDAREALGSGDLEAAERHARDVVALIEDARADGQRRAMMSGGAAAATVLLIGLLLLVWRRRVRSSGDASSDPAADPESRSDVELAGGHPGPTGPPDPEAAAARDASGGAALVAELDTRGEAEVERRVGVDVGRLVDLDEDALPRAGLSGVDGRVDES